MTEYAVDISLRQLRVSATTPTEAVARAAEMVAGDLAKHTTNVTVEKVDRIVVPGFKRP